MTDCGCLLQHARAIQLPPIAPKKMAWSPFSKSFEILAPRRSRSYAKSLKVWQRKCTPALLPLEQGHSKCCQPLLINFLLGTSRLSGSAFLFCNLWTFCSSVYFFITNHSEYIMPASWVFNHLVFLFLTYRVKKHQSGRHHDPVDCEPLSITCHVGLSVGFPSIQNSLVLFSLRLFGLMWDKYSITICEKVFTSLWTCGCRNFKACQGWYVC